MLMLNLTNTIVWMGFVIYRLILNKSAKKGSGIERFLILRSGIVQLTFK